MSNSATRLLNVMDKLAQATEVKSALLSFNQGDADKDENIRVARSLLRIYDLYETTVQQVKTISDKNDELHLGWIKGVRNALRTLNVSNENTSLTSFLAKSPAHLFPGFPESFNAAYNDKVKMSLQFCEHEFKKNKAKAVFSEDNRASLYEQASVLHQDVLSSDDLSQEIKSFMLDKIQDILNAITYYDFTGDQGIVKATENAIGACMVRPSFYTSKIKNCIDFMKFLSAIMVVVQNADKCYKISSDWMDKLLNL